MKPPLHANYSCSNFQKTYSQLLLPFAGIYVLYILADLVPFPSPILNQALKFIACSSWLVAYRSYFNLDALCLKKVLIALITTFPALFVWLLPMWWRRDAAETADLSMIYWSLRLLNSAILIALGEELFVRGYVSQWIYQAQHASQGNFFNSLLDTLDQQSITFEKLPVSFMSYLGGMLVFTFGHSPAEYLSASLYYSLTHWIYFQSRSLTTVILIHGMVNAAIALAVYWGGYHFLWF